MKTLLLLRHAKSSWDNPRLADFERPLNGRGRADAPRMGALLHREGLEPDLIITSSAKRALATATAVAEAFDDETALQATRELYMAGPEEFLGLLAEVPETVSTLLMVGHNPGLEELLEELTGQWERLPTAALAQIALPAGSWPEAAAEGRGSLVQLWRPKEIAK